MSCTGKVPKEVCPVCNPDAAEQELIVLRAEVAHRKLCLERAERKLPLTDLEAQVEAYKARLDRALGEAGDLREELSEARERIEGFQDAQLREEARLSRELELSAWCGDYIIALRAELDELEFARCQRDLWRDAYEAPPWEAKDPEAIKLVEVDLYVTGEVTS